MPATDTMKGFARTPTAPANSAIEITPDDSNDLAIVSGSIYVGLTGDLAVVMEKGQTVTFNNVAAGSILPIRVTRVLQTGTTASNIVPMWSA